MQWGIVLTDLSGNPYGELQQASARAGTLGLSRPRLGGFTIRRDNPLMPHVLDADKTLVKLYSGLEKRASGGTPDLRICGPICSVDKSVDQNGGSLGVVFGGATVRLGGRLIGKSATGATYAPGTYADKTLAGWQVIQDCRLDYAGADHDHGIRQGTLTNAGPLTAPGYGPAYFKDGLTALSELSTPMDGFDWVERPVEPTQDAQGVALCYWDAAPWIGTVRQNTIFEYGTGRNNVAAWRHLKTAVSNPGQGQQGLCNYGFSLPTGFPDNATQSIIPYQDSASVSDRGLWEAVITSDIVADALRTKLVQQSVNIRRTPQEVITFQPVSDPGQANADPGSPAAALPQYGTDYVEGDVVTFRAVEEGVLTVDGQFRVYQVQMAVDEQGMATPTFTLINDGTY